MCGDNVPALARFLEARDGAPHVVETHVALLRAASQLARGDIERDALAQALRLHPHDPDIALHAALDRVPEDLSGARALLAPHRHRPMIALFDDAIAALADGSSPPRPADDPMLQARWASFGWVRRHARSPRVFVGPPTRVLAFALQSAPARGLTLECGVYFGRSLRIIARASDGIVHGFDSFEGLPEAWNPREGAGAYSTGGRLPETEPNVVLHRGWFDDTLPPFFAGSNESIRLLHVDCDLYSSTRSVLDAAADRLVAGSIVVFDDLLGYPGYEAHELRAFEEYVAERHVRWEPIAACLLGREVAIRILPD